MVDDFRHERQRSDRDGESIEFTDTVPKWQKVGDILQPLATTKAVLLPDGKVLIGQGVNRSPGCNVNGRPCTFEEREGHHFQMFDPATGSVTKLAKTTVSRGLHGTATLLPDATVFFAGENREALVRPDNPALFTDVLVCRPASSRGSRSGCPGGQVFSPAYLFQRGGGRSARPNIVHAAGEISYGGGFDIRIAGRADQIASVALLRSDHNTHSLTAGDRYVKLAFSHQGPASGDLRVTAPGVPAQAVPGIYMLYIVDTRGVPSVGHRINLK